MATINTLTVESIYSYPEAIAIRQRDPPQGGEPLVDIIRQKGPKKLIERAYWLNNQPIPEEVYTELYDRYSETPGGYLDKESQKQAFDYGNRVVASIESTEYFIVLKLSRAIFSFPVDLV